MENDLIVLCLMLITTLMLVRFYLVYTFRTKKKKFTSKTVVDFYNHLFTSTSIVECFFIVPYSFELKNRKTIYIDIISYLTYLLTFIFIILLIIDS